MDWGHFGIIKKEKGITNNEEEIWKLQKSNGLKFYAFLFIDGGHEKLNVTLNSLDWYQNCIEEIVLLFDFTR